MWYRLNEDKTIQPSVEYPDNMETVRRVAEDFVENILISTVFLSLDHGFHGAAPIVFETMVFESKDSFRESHCVRYSTYQAALDGHNQIIEEVKLGQHRNF